MHALQLILEVYTVQSFLEKLRWAFTGRCLFTGRMPLVPR